jgi:hypothetical protein
MSLDQYKEVIATGKRYDLPLDHRFRGTNVYESDGKRFYETWYPSEIPVDANDFYFTVTSGTANRLDLISFAQYGTTDYYWLLAMINEINDPLGELPAGSIIRCITPQRLAFLHLQPKGSSNARV